MALATMSVKVDENVKKDVEVFCAAAGMNPSVAVNMFFKAMLRENKLPFEVVGPRYNAETLAAIEESRLLARDPNAKSYSSFDEILAEIDEEIAEEKV